VKVDQAHNLTDVLVFRETTSTATSAAATNLGSIMRN
jgi:hypothetical protein